MPVTTQRQLAYPGGSLQSQEWLALRKRILDRDGHACKTCRLPNHSVISRGVGPDTGRFMFRNRQIQVPCTNGALVTFDDTCVYHEETGEFIDVALEGEFSFEKTIRVILTIAHLDHDPRNNDPANLAALCQLHHNRHDAKHRAASRRMRRNGDLFLDVGAI